MRIVLVTLLLGLALTAPEPARCQSGACYTNACRTHAVCGPSCFCAGPRTEPQGFCVPR